MPATVPTQAEFEALQARVAELEAGGTVDPIDPPDPPVTGEESPEGTCISGPGQPDIIDSIGVAWNLHDSPQGNQISRGGTIDPATHHVLELGIWSHVISQRSEYGWYKWTDPSGWSPGTNPKPSQPQPGLPPPDEFVDTPPVKPTDAIGYVAQRTFDLLNGIGVNTFCNGQDGSGECRSAEDHIRGIRWITAGSGSGMLLREYANTDDQQAFCSTVAEGTGSQFVITVSWQESVDIVLRLMQSSHDSNKWMKFAQGVNEPNNTANFGFGETPAAACLDIQKKLHSKGQQLGIPVLLPPCCENGDPYFIENYFGSTMAEMTANSDFYASHDYPNSYSVNKEFQDRSVHIGQRTNIHTGGIMTEWHALLYNREKEEKLGAFWALVAHLSGAKDTDLLGIIHYCFYDYSIFGTPVGWFRNFDVDDPRPNAIALRNLYWALGDLGKDRATFTPGRVDYTIEGLPEGYNEFAGGQALLFQVSLGQYRLLLWNEQDAFSSNRSQVKVKFKSAKAKVVDYSLTEVLNKDQLPAAKQNLSNVSEITVDLAVEVRCLAITL